MAFSPFFYFKVWPTCKKKVEHLVYHSKDKVIILGYNDRAVG